MVCIYWLFQIMLYFFDLILKETDFSITTDTSNFIKNAVVKNSIEKQANV